MRRISLIGWAAVATIAATAADPSAAEAGDRGFRLRLGVGAAAAATPVPVRPAEPPATGSIPLFLSDAAATSAPRWMPATPKSGPVSGLVPVSAATAPDPAKPSPKPVRVAGPWCPQGRIVGAGAGFCEVN